MKLLALAISAFVLGLAAVSPASASHLSCGQVVFVDVVLDSDLLDCKGHGLVVGVSGVDIDLNGHLIDGEGPPPPFTMDQPGEGDFGIYNPAFQDVTIVGGKGGRIQGFDTGILIEGATNNLVERVNVADNRTGIRVHKNSTNVRIIRNTIVDAVVIAIAVQSASDIEISRNVIVEAIFWGVSVFGSSDVTVERNSVNGGHIGISVSDGMRNSVLRNEVSEASRSNLTAGIDVGAGAVATTVDRNTVAGSDGDGISVDLEADLTEVTRNITEKNDDDGIDVNSSSTTLGKNLAVGNGDLGIEAVPGVTDLGANSASGNGDPRQCTNVVCRR